MFVDRTVCANFSTRYLWTSSWGEGLRRICTTDQWRSTTGDVTSLTEIHYTLNLCTDNIGPHGGPLKVVVFSMTYLYQKIMTNFNKFKGILIGNNSKQFPPHNKYVRSAHTT